MSNSEIEQSGTVKGHLPNEASISGRISNGLSLSGHISIGGAGDFIIKMTVESNGSELIVTSCDTTVEQIDEAVAAEKRVVLIATDTTSGGFWEMPLVQAFQGETYIFMAYTFSGYVMSTVYKYGENETWEFVESGISAESVDYYNSTQPDVETVLAALNKLFTNSHTHANKSVLDKFAETDGKPTYDGKALGGGGGTSDFIIKMTVESDDSGNYTITSCDATFEQIDAAYNSDKNIVIKVAASGYQGDFSCSLPVVSAAQGSYYYFCGLDDLYVYLAFFDPNHSEFSVLNFSANNITYSNTALPNVKNVKAALDELVPKSHTHANKDTLDKLSVSNGKLQYNGSDVGLKGDKGDTPVKGTDYWTAADKQEIIDDIHPAYYIDLAGKYPNYTCPVAMDDIKAAYNAGYNLVCRCQMGAYTATLPLFIPMPVANTWIFSGSGCLQSMGFPAQSFTIAITANGVVAQNKELVALGGTLPNPYELQITVGGTSYIYDGSEYVNIVIDDGTEVSY